MKSIESRLHLKKRLYRFQLKRWLPIGEHMNNYTMLLANLVNVDVEIEEEDKAAILLNSLSDNEYETSVITLINSKQTLNYTDVSAALVNNEVRNNKQSSSKSDLAEALMVRCRSSSKKKKTIVRDQSPDRVSEI